MAVNAPAGPVRARLAEVVGPGDRREIYLLPVEETPAPDGGALFDGLPVALMRFDAGGVLIAAVFTLSAPIEAALLNEYKRYE